MTQAQIQKLNRLNKEVEILKSAVLGILPLDREGEYKESFIREVKRASKQKPVFEYRKQGDLLNL